MKISRLLFLGVLASSLCMAGSASAACLLADGIGPSTSTPGPYRVGDEICYEITLISIDCDMQNVDVYFFAPDDPPTSGPCDGPINVGGGVKVADDIYLSDGVPYILDCTGNTDLLYVVKAGDLTDADGLDLVAKIATEFTPVGGSQDCDQATSEEEAVPPEPETIVTILSSDSEVCEGGTVTLTVTETNQGTTPDEALTDPYVVLLANGAPVAASPLDDSSSEFDDTTDNGNGILDPGESWEWEVDVAVSVNTTFEAIGHGTDVFGNDVTWCEDIGDPPALTICDQEERDTVDVDVIEAPDCLIEGPVEVCDDASEVPFSTTVDADTYSWSVTGDAVIDEVAVDGMSILVTPTSAAGFTVHLKVCYVNDYECCNTCDLSVDVVPTPVCEISGPNPVCEGTQDVVYTGPAADRWSWSIVGNATIDGPTDQQSVTVDVGTLGAFTLSLEVCNDGDVIECCDDCSLRVTVEECGGYCGLTQGFWGNAGGKFMGTSTTDLIMILLGLDPETDEPGDIGPNPVVIGDALLGPSIEFDTAVCILMRLPAGGKAKALPSFGQKNCADTDFPPNLLHKDGRFKNVLIGQVVALSLNVRLDVGDYGMLGDFGLPEGYFCTIGEEEGDCPERFMIPESVLEALDDLALERTVDNLLMLANMALAGDLPNGLVGDIADAVGSINEAFDECRFEEGCAETETECGDGCDNDFDGFTDCEGDGDPDCDCGT